MLKNIVVASLVFLAGTLACGGELPLLRPGLEPKPDFTAKLTPGGAVAVVNQGESFAVASEYSLVPGWAALKTDKAEGLTAAKVEGDTFTAESATFTLTRKLKRFPECVEIEDTIVNKTGANLAMMNRHSLTLPQVEAFHLCGLRSFMKKGRQANSRNPSVVCITAKSGVGLLALDDAFRVHCLSYSGNNVYGLADNDLALAPQASHTIRFAVYLTGGRDYFDVVNAMRRQLGVNYTVVGSFAFLSPNPRGIVNKDGWYPADFQGDRTVDRVGKDHPLEDIKNFLDYKSADYPCATTISAIKEMGHGSAWMQTAQVNAHNQLFDKVRQVRPAATRMHYFHCYLDWLPYCEGKFLDCRTLNPDGKQADYRNPREPLFHPTLDNEWGRVMHDAIGMLLEKYHIEGIFWDEFVASAADYHCGEPWDQASADIDANTHEIKRLKSSITLLSLPWRLAEVKRITDAGKLLMVNGGGAATDSMLKLFVERKVQGFCETGAITNVYGTHLSTPVGLGDHLTERIELHAYRQMVKQLQHGALYYWYHQQVMPVTHATLTSHMYPLTPVELHEGYIIGKERIVTARSGWFSFGDAANAEAHFYDANGYEAQRPLEQKTADGKTFFKVELAEWESCALVRK